MKNSKAVKRFYVLMILEKVRLNPGLFFYSWESKKWMTINEKD